MELNNTKILENISKVDDLDHLLDVTSNNLHSLLQQNSEQAKEIAELAAKYDGYSSEKSEKEWKIILEDNGLNLRLVPVSMQTEGLYLAAFSQNSNAIQFVEKDLLSKDLCEFALRRKYTTIRFIPNKPGLISFETCKEIIQKDGLLLAFVIDKDSWGFTKDEMCELYEIAIRQNPFAFGLIGKEYRTSKLRKLAFGTEIQLDHEDISPIIINALNEIDIKFSYLKLMFHHEKMST